MKFFALSLLLGVATAQKCKTGIAGLYVDTPCSQKCCDVASIKYCQNATYCEAQGGTVSEPFCFSADQTVDVKKSTGEVVTIRMDELKVGDNVRVGLQGEFSKVFAFGHKDHEAFTQMIRIETDHGHIKLSAGHYIYANGVRKLARDVEHGEMLHHHDGKLAAIKKIEEVMAHGIFAPHTVHGDIIVNGHKASCYTEAIKPEVAHAVLKPFAFLFDQGFESAGKLAESLINVRSELAMKLLGSKE